MIHPYTTDLITRLHEASTDDPDLRGEVDKLIDEAWTLIKGQADEIEALKKLTEAAQPQPTTEQPITVSHAIATTTDIVRLRAAAKLWWDAMHGQHEILAHWLDGCRKCRKARREGEPSYACDQYQAWQKQYTDAVGAW